MIVSYLQTQPRLTICHRADELYVETFKDRNAAHNLLEEIEMAKLYHPTPRQSSNFTSRADTLIKRLVLRGNPFSDVNLFPCPTHSLFSEQAPFNEYLVRTLSSELSSTGELVSKIDLLAKEYRAGYEAVKEVDTLSQSLGDSLLHCRSIIERLSNGVVACDGDGSPPDLSSEHCLDPTAHAAFLTLLPSILQEFDQLLATVTKLMGAYQLALHNVDRPGIDPTFKQNAAARFDVLLSVRDETLKVVDDTNARVGRLRVVRRVWSMMYGVKKGLQNIQSDIAEILVKERWMQQMDTTEPLTPQSPDVELPAAACSKSRLDILPQLDSMRHTLSHDIANPLASLSGSLEQPLDDLLARASADLLQRLDNIKAIVAVVEAVRSQSSVMASIQEDVHDLQLKIEDLRIRFDVAIEEILTGEVSDETLEEEQSHLQADADSLRKAVRTFTDGIAQRVQFVSCGPYSQVFTRLFSRRAPSVVDIRVGSELPSTTDLPFTLGSLDDAIRADCNSFTMRLAGNVGSLDRKVDGLKLACMAKVADAGIAAATEDLRGINREFESLRSTLSSISQQEEKLAQLQVLSQEVEQHASHHRSHLFRSLSFIRESLRQMDTVPNSQALLLQEPLLTTRRRATDDLEIKVNLWSDRTAMLLGEVSELLLMETRRLEALRIQREREAEERRQRAEMERLAEETRIREARRLEEEQRVQEHLAREEAERLVQQQLREKEEREAQERLIREETEREADEQRAGEEAEREERETEEQLARTMADMEAQERLSQEKMESEAGGSLLHDCAETQDTSSQPQDTDPVVSTEAEAEQERHEDIPHCSDNKVAEQPSWHARKRSGSVFSVPFSPIHDDEGQWFSIEGFFHNS